MQQGIYFSHCSMVFQKGGGLVGQAVKMEKGTELLRPQQNAVRQQTRPLLELRGVSR